MVKISGSVYVLLSVIAAFALVIILRGLLVEVSGAEILEVKQRSSYNGAPVPGFVVFKTCVAEGPIPDVVSSWLLVKPDAVIVISNPVSSPNGCVKIRGGGTTIYVEGTEIEVAAKIRATATD